MHSHSSLDLFGLMVDVLELCTMCDPSMQAVGLSGGDEKILR